MDARLDLRRELRKLVFGLCCAIGGLAGLWWAILTVPPGRGPAEVIGPVAAHFGAGFGAGVAIGLLACLTALRSDRP